MSSVSQRYAVYACVIEKTFNFDGKNSFGLKTKYHYFLDDNQITQSVFDTSRPLFPDKQTFQQETLSSYLSEGKSESHQCIKIIRIAKYYFLKKPDEGKCKS